MSVEKQLGLGDSSGPLIAQASERWSAWRDAEPGLGPAEHLDQFLGWLPSQVPDVVDEALAALARLASRHGADDTTAAALLIWILLPGAGSLAVRMRSLSPVIDELVAAQLWLEVRARPAPRSRVASNVLFNTKKGVLRELGLGPHGAIRARVTLVDPTSRAWQDIPDTPVTSRTTAHVQELLDTARKDRVITDDERTLLLEFASATDCGAGARYGPRGGLTSVAATTRMCEQLGISPRTARRRLRRVLDSLADAYPEYKVPA